MRRNLVVRLFAGVFAAWLAVCLLEPMQLRLCSMHGGLAIDVSGVPTQSAHGAALKHQATHSHHNGDTGGHSTQCSCLGDCSVGSAPPPVASVQISIEDTVSTTGARYSSVEAQRYHGAADLLLPFSNGPPTVS